MPDFGLWKMISQRPVSGDSATDRQTRACRYLIGDMPSNGVIGFDAARELLSVRSYAIGLLANLYRHGSKLHPRETMWWLLHEAYHDPAILKAICLWNKDRYFEDRGPARVGATRHFQQLSAVVVANCSTPMPSESQCIVVRDAALKLHGLGGLVAAKSPTIEYGDGGETTVRTISAITLQSRWPWWSYLLINPPSFISVNAFCHLRREHRTFAAYKITRIH